MRKSTDVLGLHVMGMREGIQDGIVQDFVVDVSARSVKYLILKSDVGYRFRAVKVSDVIGIGADYTITSSIANIMKLYEEKDVAHEVENGFFLLGATVLMSGGDVIGKVTNFEFDEKNGTLLSILLDSGNEFSAEKIVSMSGQIVIIDPNGSAQFKKFESISKEAIVKKAVIPEIKIKQEEPPKETESPFDKESKDFLVGRVLNNDVKSEDGTFFIKKGTKLTQKLVDDAKKYDLILALTLNV